MATSNISKIDKNHWIRYYRELNTDKFGPAHDNCDQRVKSNQDTPFKVNDIKTALINKLTPSLCLDLVMKLMNDIKPKIDQFDKDVSLSLFEMICLPQGQIDDVSKVTNLILSLMNDQDIIYSNFFNTFCTKYLTHYFNILRIKQDDPFLIKKLESFLTDFPEETIPHNLLVSNNQIVTFPIVYYHDEMGEMPFALPLYFHRFIIKFNLAIALLHSFFALDPNNVAYRSTIISILGKASYLFDDCAKFIANIPPNTTLNKMMPPKLLFNHSFLNFMSDFALLGIFYSEIILFINQLKHQNDKSLENKQDLDKLQRLMYGYATKLQSMLSNIKPSNNKNFIILIGFTKAIGYNIFAAACIVNSFADFLDYVNTGQSQSELSHAVLLLGSIKSRILDEVKTLEDSMNVLNTSTYFQKVPLWINPLRVPGYNVRHVPIVYDSDKKHTDLSDYMLFNAPLFMSDSFHKKFSIQISRPDLKGFVTRFSSLYAKYLNCMSEFDLLQKCHKELKHVKDLFIKVDSISKSSKKKPLQFCFIITSNGFLDDFSKAQLLEKSLSNDIKRVYKELKLSLKYIPNQKLSESKLNEAHDAMNNSLQNNLINCDSWIKEMKEMEGYATISQWSFKKFNLDFSSISQQYDRFETIIRQYKTSFEPLIESFMQYIVDEVSDKSKTTISASKMPENSFDSRLDSIIDKIPYDIGQIQQEISSINVFCKKYCTVLIQCLTWFKNINTILQNAKIRYQFTNVLNQHVNKMPRDAHTLYMTLLKSLKFILNLRSNILKVYSQRNRMESKSENNNDDDNVAVDDDDADCEKTNVSNFHKSSVSNYETSSNASLNQRFDSMSLTHTDYVANNQNQSNYFAQNTMNYNPYNNTGSSNGMNDLSTKMNHSDVMNQSQPQSHLYHQMPSNNPMKANYTNTMPMNQMPLNNNNMINSQYNQQVAPITNPPYQQYSIPNQNNVNNYDKNVYRNYYNNNKNNNMNVNPMSYSMAMSNYGPNPPYTPLPYNTNGSYGYQQPFYYPTQNQGFQNIIQHEMSTNSSHVVAPHNHPYHMAQPEHNRSFNNYYNYNQQQQQSNLDGSNK